MVGVPGRSKGCETCRRRKKGCDRKRPSCSQCIQAGIYCGGYERQRVFLNRTQDTEAGSVPISYRRDVSAAVSSRSSSSSPARSSSGSPDITLPQTLAQSAYADRYIGLYLADYLPVGRAPTTTPAARSPSAWFNAIYGLRGSNRSVYLSLLALSLCGIGRRDDDAALTKKGLVAHSLALQELTKSLHSSNPATSDAILGTSKLLSQYEILYGEDKADFFAQSRNWDGHTNGQMAMVLARDPHDYRFGLSHDMFVTERWVLLVCAIRDRKRFVLNTPEWRTIPWQFEPKSPKDKLLDVLGDLSEILEDTDQMQACHSHDVREILRNDIIHRCWLLDAVLHAWVEAEGPLKIFCDANDELVDPSSLDDFALAHVTTVYWTTCLQLYMTLRLLYEGADIELPAHTNPDLYSRALAKALPYFFRPSAGIMGANTSAFPLAMCLQLLFSSQSECLEDRKLIGDLLELPQVRNTIKKFILGQVVLNGSATDSIKAEMAHMDETQRLKAYSENWKLVER